MRLISNQNTETHLTEILRAIECFDEIIICVAFLKCSGLNFLIEKLNKKKEKTIFYVGLDFYQTEPTALRQLLNYGHKVFLTQKSKVTFHPKIFYFKRKNNITAFIGSSNLTYGGLETNFETSIVFQTVTNSKIDNELKQAFNSFDKNSKVADSESIDYYEKLFDLYKQKHNQADDQFSIEEEKIIEEKR
ncbi:MAG: phospholipase D family protein, partial [Flavobacteriaceae bacterium]|nr:phospholipase D family protein [Flavobacteriaceae bacterium]